MEFSCLLVVLNLVSCEAAMRIIGGRDALRDEFSFAVRLEIKVHEHSNGVSNYVYEQLCTGTALTSEWILSAAHCYDKDIEIFARYNSYFPKEMGEISPILEVYIHPQYLKDNRVIQNDLGLFRSRSIQISQYGKISAVDYKSLLGHEVNVLGFGGTNATDRVKPLQVLNGMINKCLEYEEYHDISHTPICVVKLCTTEATICGGDSGGPVIHPSGVVGVNSAGVNDCNEFTTDLHLYPGTSASILATVSQALDWISKVISNKTTI